MADLIQRSRPIPTNGQRLYCGASEAAVHCATPVIGRSGIRDAGGRHRQWPSMKRGSPRLAGRPNALRKSVGDDLGEDVFAKWLERQRAQVKGGADPVAVKIAGALAGFESGPQFRPGNHGHTARQASWCSRTKSRTGAACFTRSIHAIVAVVVTVAWTRECG